MTSNEKLLGAVVLALLEERKEREEMRKQIEETYLYYEHEPQARIVDPVQRYEYVVGNVSITIPIYRERTACVSSLNKIVFGKLGINDDVLDHMFEELCVDLGYDTVITANCNAIYFTIYHNPSHTVSCMSIENALVLFADIKKYNPNLTITCNYVD
jgi:hypothetical protein